MTFASELCQRFRVPTVVNSWEAVRTWWKNYWNWLLIGVRLFSSFLFEVQWMYLNGPIPASFCIFVLFSSQFKHRLKKAQKVVLGNRIRGHRMVEADGHNQEKRPPLRYNKLSSYHHRGRSIHTEGAWFKNWTLCVYAKLWHFRNRIKFCYQKQFFLFSWCKPTINNKTVWFYQETSTLYTPK